MTNAAKKTTDPIFIEPEVSPELGSSFGINADEYALVLEILGRTPTYTELGIFSVMWSEHCSYKSSRLHLKKLPTEAPWVIQGPGENAGVIDIGDNEAAIFKMESHNSPSAIETLPRGRNRRWRYLKGYFHHGRPPGRRRKCITFWFNRAPKDKTLY